MTRSLLLARCPLGASLINTNSLVALGVGLRAGLHQVQRFSHASSSARSQPLSASRVQQLRILSSPRRSSTTLQLQPLLKSNPHSRGNFTTARPAFSTASTTGSSSAEGKTTSNKTPKRRFPNKTLLLLATIGTLSVWFLSHSTSSDGDILLEWTLGKPLNPHSFVPFTIISRDQVSPTSFIITLKPKYSRDAPLLSSATLGEWLPRFLTETHSNKDIISKAWSYGLWSVEFKQPQLQVAREYTPLPPKYEDQEKDLEKGHLRFLIRKMDGGEVSTYLSGLSVGDDVELRGPHLGFDVRERLGSAGEKVVFLAGGTGVAPALQVVRVLLDGFKDGDGEGEGEVKAKGKGKPQVSIIWANRHRKDCEGCEGLNELLGKSGAQSSSTSSGNAVLSFLAEAKDRHGEKLRYACTVDEEGSFITPKAIADVTGLSSASSPRTNGSGTGGGFFSSFWFWSSKSTMPAIQGKNTSQAEDEKEETCPYHSAKRLITTDGNDDPLISKPSSSPSLSNAEQDQAQSAEKATASGCQCPPPNGGGKNLLIVSGPDGFISTFVGPKLWANRKELQGPVRGVVGGELRKKDPEFWKDWLVLKM
ncbi:hypothetical protein V8F20_000937 [Naviculisporaceae sp. PSN 640]